MEKLNENVIKTRLKIIIIITYPKQVYIFEVRVYVVQKKCHPKCLTKIITTKVNENYRF